MSKTCGQLVLAVAAAASLWVSPAAVTAGDLVDRAGFFSPTVVEQVNQDLARLKQETKHSVKIETFASLPESRQAEFDKLSPSQRKAFYASWLKDVAKSSQADGLLILISKQPSHVEAGISGKLKQAGYTPAQRQLVLDELLSAFRKQEFDQGLTTAVATVSTQFKDLKSPGVAQGQSPSHSVPAPAPGIGQGAQEAETPAWMGWLLIGGVVLGGLFLISLLGRAFSGAGMGGGGLFGGLMAGLFGAMAGSWLYDQFSGSSAWGQDSHNPTDGSSSASDGWDTSGGDYGGGDFGGGDFGGGDF